MARRDASAELAKRNTRGGQLCRLQRGSMRSMREAAAQLTQGAIKVRFTHREHL